MTVRVFSVAVGDSLWAGSDALPVVEPGMALLDRREQVLMLAEDRYRELSRLSEVAVQVKLSALLTALMRVPA